MGISLMTVNVKTLLLLTICEHLNCATVT